MALRTLTAVGTDQTFACGQIMSEVNMNNLNEAAQAARYRGETVVNQAGHRREGKSEIVLHGEHNSTNKTIYVSFTKDWEFENAGYEKWIARFSFRLDSNAYNALSDLPLIHGYTRLQIKHTDKAGVESTIWDSETTSPIPSRGVLNTVTIQGTFSNPPAGTDTELEKITLVAISNRSTDNVGMSSTNWSGFKSLMFKLHD